MKNIKYLFTLIVVFLASCEDVVDIDLPTAAPRLVVDASINWEKGTAGNEQVILLTTTTGFYENVIPPVSGAVVFITDSNNSVFDFIEEPGTGRYICDNFVPVLLMNYTLTVVYQNQTYTASEKLNPVPPIDEIVQRNDGGFLGEDIEIRTYYTDNGATDDYYLIKYTPSFSPIPVFGTSEDELFQGNQIYGLYFSEDLKQNDTVGIKLSAVSQQYYNYMNLIIGMTGGGGPFQSTPAPVKGNLINNTNFDNYAFGYFSVAETDVRMYTVQ